MALGLVERDILREGAKAAIRGCLNKAEEIYGRTFETPTVDFAKRGRTAATANSATWVININEALYHGNIADFLGETIPHEVAHLVADRIAGKRCKHNTFWLSVARSLGCTRANARYHNYDTSETQQKVKQRKWRYMCPRCGADDFVLSTNRHNKMQRRTHLRGHAIGHPWTELIFIGERI